MKKILILLGLLLSMITQAQQTKTQTEAQIDTLLPSNNARQITAQKIRQALKTVVNYASPSNFGVGSITLSKIAQSGAAFNQVPRWNGVSWIPYSLDNDSVSLSKLSQGSASLNQVLKWDGLRWAPANDLIGGSGGATWGTIPGQLSDQTDLQLAFNSKLNIVDTTSLLQKTTATSLYQVKGNYLTGITSGQVISALGFTPYNASNPSGYLTASAITGKLNIADTTSLLQKTTATSLYQVKGNYLTGITSGQVVSALGFTPYNASNPSGYITASALSAYLTLSMAASTYQPVGSYQNGIQFKDEGSNVGTQGAVTSVNFTGPSVSSTISGNTITADIKDYESLVVAASDEVTSITTGTAKVTFRMPYAMTVTNVRISVNTAQASGALLTVVIKENGTSILSTNLTLDNTEKSSTTAATPAVISDAILGDDSEITIDVSQIGDSTAKGLKVIINGYRN